MITAPNDSLEELAEINLPAVVCFGKRMVRNRVIIMLDERLHPEIHVYTLGNPFAYPGINITHPFCYLRGKYSFRLIWSIFMYWYMSYMYCFTVSNDWLIDRLYFDWCCYYTCTPWMGLSVWRPCCRLWHRGLSLWRPAVPPVDAGPSRWQHLSVSVFIPYEDWSSLFRLMLLPNMYTGDGAVGVTIMSSLVAPRVVLVTACGATGRCGVVTLIVSSSCLL